MKSHLAGDPEIEKLLRFDPLHEAEQITGKSYKEDEKTGVLGLVLLQQNGAAKDSALMFADDTTLSNSLAHYLRIVGELGFEQVLRLEFANKHDPQTKEQFYVFWHPDGVLLSFDTYGSDHVNGGTFYYNWKPNPQFWKSNARGVTSSGGFRLPKSITSLQEPSWREIYPHALSGKKTSDPDVMRREQQARSHFQQHAVWIGDHDCREALRHHLARLREHGSFVNPWVEPPFLWLIHHGDKLDDGSIPDHKKITQERLKLLPEHVQLCICVGNSADLTKQTNHERTAADAH